ncbi:MAG: ATP-binding cassette domain-containing protein [Halieaceae bacterium]|jgi:ATP-binding cassette subfamily F protein 3|nr:ATP-binding cassette domain-containing protein [Halieaceae bacterium]
MIILRNISLRRGPRTLLENVEVTIAPGQHMALTGANGCGKSTLFAALLGELGLDAGEIEGLDNMRLAAMAQEVESSEMPALDFVISGDPIVAPLRQALRDAEQREDFAVAADLHQKMDAENGYEIERKASKLLLGLGFDENDGQRTVRSFSGGWRVRLGLARALMTPSDLLLLDEPTNHLDLDTTLWLQQWLAAYPGTLLLISHDRDFIDATCDQVLHLEHRKLTAYRGNYSAFERQRAERLAQQQASYEKQQRRIAEIDDFVRRFRAKATKAKQAQSRLKELSRMQEIAPAHVDSPFSFRFPTPGRASDPILALDKAALGYAGRTVLENVSLTLRPGSRIGLLGRNGAGKSTLLKSLLGELPLLAGERIEGAHCRVGYFDQHQLEALDLDASAQLQLQRLRPEAREQDILDFLGGFGFRGEAATESVAPFSGGEKTRLALAMVVWQQPNLLVMDEPTNHLDMDMRYALTLALQGFEGAMVLVTHDRHLLRNTVDELLLVDDGKVSAYGDDVQAYERWVLGRESAAPKPAAGGQGNRREERQAAARQRDALRPLKKQIRDIETAMAKADAALAALEQQLADAGLYESGRKDELDQLLKDQGRLRRESESLDESWLSLQTELEALEESLAAG